MGTKPEQIKEERKKEKWTKQGENRRKGDVKYKKRMRTKRLKEANSLSPTFQNDKDEKEKKRNETKREPRLTQGDIPRMFYTMVPSFLCFFPLRSLIPVDLGLFDKFWACRGICYIYIWSWGWVGVGGFVMVCGDDVGDGKG